MLQGYLSAADIIAALQIMCWPDADREMKQHFCAAAIPEGRGQSLMKMTFPHMGTAHVGVKTILEQLGHEVVMPPRVSSETVNLGAKYSPETACFPLKITLGNFLQVLQEHPDTEAVLMVGGAGPCRLGYYFRTQQDILADLGYDDLEWVVIEPPQGNFREMLERLKGLAKGCSLLDIISALRLGWRKMVAMDELIRAAHRVRPREVRRGSTSHLLRTAASEIEAASELGAVEEVHQSMHKRMQGLIGKGESRDVVRIAMVGEIYLTLEPGANLHVEEALGHMGAEIQRTIMITDWVRDNVLLDFLPWNNRGEDKKEAAKPYLNHFVGGEGQDSVGSTALLADEVDGVVHLMPFTCMPEIVAQSVMPEVIHDFDIPVLTLVFDEHTARAGMLTRLEAFVDLLRRRRVRDRHSPAS